MIRKFGAALALLALTAGTTAPAARTAGQCWVLTRSGQRISGIRLTARPDGTLELALGRRGPIQRFRPGAYRAAFIPEPNYVRRLALLFEQKQYDQVIQFAPNLFNQLKFLGWGDYIAALHASALLEKGRAKEALQVIQAAQPFVGLHGDELTRARVLALVKLGKKEQALAELKKLSGSNNPKLAAFAFNLRGDILAEEGKKKDAVLQYLKTVLLFSQAELGPERTDARKKVVALLKELKDPRYKDFEKLH